jgi:hypothetical protein
MAALMSGKGLSALDSRTRSPTASTVATDMDSVLRASATRRKAMVRVCSCRSSQSKYANCYVQQMVPCQSIHTRMGCPVMLARQAGGLLSAAELERQVAAKKKLLAVKQRGVGHLRHDGLHRLDGTSLPATFRLSAMLPASATCIYHASCAL